MREANLYMQQFHPHDREFIINPELLPNFSSCSFGAYGARKSRSFLSMSNQVLCYSLPYGLLLLSYSGTLVPSLIAGFSINTDRVL